MDEKKRIEKKGIVILSLFILIIICIVVVVVASSNNDNATPVDNTTDITPGVPAAVDTTPVAPTSPPSIESQLQGAVGLGTVTYDPASQTASVTKTDNDPFGPTETTRDAYKTFVQFGQKAAIVSGVNVVCVVYNIPLDDQYGKKSIETVVRLVMPTSEFVKFDWKALEYQPISDKLQASCTEYYIHPALAGTRPSDLFLPPI